MIDWEKWLGYTDLDRFNKIHICNIPANFFPVDILPLAFQLLKSEGLLILEFSGYVDLLQVSARISEKARNFYLESLNPGDRNVGANFDASRCIAFRYQGDARKNKILVRSTTGFNSELMTLYQAVFGHAISDEYWRWKYPSDTENQTLIALSGRQVIAHYGVSPRRIRASAKPLLAAQVGDVMVDSTHRGGLVTSSFAQVAHITMMQMQKEVQSDPYWTDYTVGFGFPHGRQMKMARRLSLYHDGGDVRLVSFRFAQLPSSIDVVSLELDSAAAKAAWEQAYPALNASLSESCHVDRDWRYLLERYCYHPEKSYTCVALPDAMFILSLFPDGVYRVIDYLGELEHLTQNIRMLAAYQGVKEIRMWLMDWVEDRVPASQEVQWGDVKASLALMYPEGGSFEANCQAKWWITLGDADFI